ncbi:MAG: AMP-binding protein [Desulfurivibrionaceae bacterium]
MNVEKSIPAAAGEARVLDIVRQLVAEVHPSTYQQLAIALDSSLDRDLGLDSLTRVELLARLEKSFAVALPESVMAGAETPRDLLRTVLAASPGEEGETAAPDRESVPPQQETPGKALAAPATAATLAEILRYHAENHGERTHIRLYSEAGDDEIISYTDLYGEAALLAAGLQSQGLAAGETVLIMLATGRDYFISFFGVLLAGAVPVPVYPPGRIKQIEEHLRRHAAIAANCQAKIMITMEEALNFTRLMHKKAINLETVATVAELQAAGRGRTLHQPVRGGGDTAFIQYTSGSTGTPKGVMLSNANLLANIRAMGRAIEVSSDDVFVSWLPLYHDMGLIGAWLGSLYFACPLVIMSPLTFLARPVRWLKAISRHRGTLAAAPNFAYELCRRRIDDGELQGIDLGSWRCAFNGAEAVSPAIIDAFSERFAPFGFRPQAMMPVYGLAESSVGLAFPPLGRGVRVDRIDRGKLMKEGRAEPVPPEGAESLALPGCGFPLPGHQIRVVDDHDRELPDRRQGHIQFQGPSATSGYHRNPEETAKLFHGSWLDSGDLGYLADGEIFITGRSKDMIIKGGRNIYPVELEEAVGEIEGVRQGNVAVFGSTDRQSGTERLVVLAETRKRRPEDLRKIRQEINGTVTDISGTAPDEVVLAPPNTVLKTSSGKIRRNSCQELYEQGRVGKSSRPPWLQLTAFALASSTTQLRKGMRNLADLGYAAYAWLLFGLGAPFSILAVGLLPTVNLRWQCNRLLVKLVFMLAGTPLKIEGMANLPARDTPCILAVNHASYLDSIILAGVLPRPFGFIAKAELRANPLLGWLLPRLGTEFVERFDRAEGVADSQKLAKRMAGGRSLAFFPEGTFMRMPGLLPFRMGAFETAAASGAMVVPVAIRGSRSVLRGRSWFPRRGRIRVIIGEPIDSEAILAEAGNDQWRVALELRNRARTWLLAHCGEPDLAYERAPLFSGKPSVNCPP